jgi:hypothetical protein
MVIAEIKTPKRVQTHKNFRLLSFLLKTTPKQAEMPAVKKNNTSPKLIKDGFAVKFSNTIPAPM